MTGTALVPVSPPEVALPDAARAELRRAVRVLEHSSLAVKLAGVVGSSVEALKRSLPTPAQRILDDAVKRALEGAMRAAMKLDPQRSGPLPSQWLHRGLLAATGMAGGVAGLGGTLIELPVSTALLLRQVAAVAAEQGEDLSDPEVQAECLKVFALGGADQADDGAESGYFTMRIALAETLKGAVGRSIGQLLPGFLGAIASRFGGPVAVKLSAQAAPLLGAAAGAAVNLAFLEHFRTVAEAHFAVRRLERQHGAATVRQAYEAARQDRAA